MKNNTLCVTIHKPLLEVFSFTVTPPNSTLWIPSIIKEEATPWPLQQGTIYTLVDSNGKEYNVSVEAYERNKIITWTSLDKNYYVTYTYRSISSKTTELIYHEWVKTGEIESPFTQSILNKLKTVLEQSS